MNNLSEKTPDNEEGSMVSADDVKKKEERQKMAIEKIAENTALICKSISGLAIALATVNGSINKQTETLMETREELNSLLTLLVTGKTVVPESTKDIDKIPPATQPSTPVTQPPLPATPTQAPAQQIKVSQQTFASPPSNPKPSPTNEVEMQFPEDLAALLSFEEKADYITIKPKQFLGSENFAKIASTVRGIGGEYISAGRDSHFRVYKKN